MAIDAVVRRIDLAADKPLPAGRVARVERRVPVLIPIEEVGVFFKTFGKVVQAKAVVDRLK
jgi:hypothetical protein